MGEGAVATGEASIFGVEGRIKCKVESWAKLVLQKK